MFGLLRLYFGSIKVETCKNIPEGIANGRYQFEVISNNNQNSAQIRFLPNDQFFAASLQ